MLAKADFFDNLHTQGIALTYDDVRLMAARSSTTTQSVNTTSRFSKNVPLVVPIASAAMDTVTTAPMAIEMAKCGGIGVIHAGLSIDEQFRHVRRVKLHTNGIIDTPITVSPTDTLQDVLDMCAQKGFSFRSFPVVDDSGKLLGLVTRRDFAFAIDFNTTIETVMTPRSELTVGTRKTTTKSAHKTMQQLRRKALPLVDTHDVVCGMYELSDVTRVLRGNPDQYNLDAQGRLCVAAAVPTDDGALERIERMIDYLDVAVVDTAQGDSEFAFQTLERIKHHFPRLDVVVGNVSNPESAAALAKAGADGIKVGQGPGSICTTRIETGIGTPQVTAVYECAQAVAQYDIPVIADGGITNAGDISIAVAAGASSVMLGSGLAGTKESPGDVVMGEDGTMVKMYRGMGSASAMRESEASRKRYGATASSGKPLAEGVESHVAYKGPVHDVMDHYTKALKKSMSYVGAADINAHRASTKLIRITSAGIRESHPHNVRVI